MTVGVACGYCGGPIYMETCEQSGGPTGHEWVLASECQQCGVRYVIESGCLDCAVSPTPTET